jgi:ATP-dependent Clp protease ATP-binding subunit ClpA
MFERYTDCAKHAIFYARVLAVVSDRSEITTVNLLCGLLCSSDSRIETIFQLRERFLLYNGCPCKYEKLPQPAVESKLSAASRQALAWAAIEANELRDYWIDAEHLLLGILRVRECDAANYLMRTGLTLAKARRSIKQNRHSRPVYGPVPLWWRIKNYVMYPIPA